MTVLVIASDSEAIQEMRSRTNLWFSAMTCGWWNVPKYVIAHLLRDLWIASSQAPRNDVKCAALSLAALNDFVCEANGTHVHSVKAMPQAAQISFAGFSLCLLLQLRALLETCKMASLFHSVVKGSFLSLLGCSRITSSRALPYGNALHSTLTIRFASQTKEKKLTIKRLITHFTQRRVIVSYLRH